MTNSYKKIAVVILFLSVLFGLFYFIKNFNIESERRGEKIGNDNLVLTWSHTPKEIALGDQVDFTFHLRNNKGHALPDAEIDIKATMNHNDVTPIFTKAKYIKNSMYRAQTKLTKLGEWVLFLTITLPSGEVINKEVSFKTK